MDTFKKYQAAMSAALEAKSQISRAIMQAGEAVSKDARIKYVAIPNNDYGAEPGWALSIFIGTDNRSSIAKEFKMFFVDAGGLIAYHMKNKVVYIDDSEMLKRLIRTEYFKAAQAYEDKKDSSAVSEAQCKMQQWAGIGESKSAISEDANLYSRDRDLTIGWSDKFYELVSKLSTGSKIIRNTANYVSITGKLKEANKLDEYDLDFIWNIQRNTETNKFSISVSVSGNKYVHGGVRFNVRNPDATIKWFDVYQLPNVFTELDLQRGTRTLYKSFIATTTL